MAGGRFNIWSVALLIVLLGLSVAARFPLLDFQTQDYQQYLFHWYGHIERSGGWAALGNTFAAYNVPYIYLLTIFTYLPFKTLYAVKAASIIFDYLAAFWVYKIVRLKYPSGMLPWAAFILVIFAPTVIINSSMWAQSDSIYTSFLLGSLYFMIKLARGQGRNRRFILINGGLVLVMFALALSFKLQAIFFVLPLLFILVSRAVRWYTWLLLPLVYLLALLPSNLLGTPWTDLLNVYVGQVELHKQLTLNAPSVYGFIPNAPSEIIGQVGMIFTAAAAVFVVWLLAIKKVSFYEEVVVRVTMLSALMIPYLLPRMHERYFFLADLVAIVFAFYFPRYWFIPVGVIGVSLFSYAHLALGGPVVGLEMLSLAMGIILLIVGRDFVLSDLLAKRDTKLNP